MNPPVRPEWHAVDGSMGLAHENKSLSPATKACALAGVLEIKVRAVTGRVPNGCRFWACGGLAEQTTRAPVVGAQMFVDRDCSIPAVLCRTAFRLRDRGMEIAEIADTIEQEVDEVRKLLEEHDLRNGQNEIKKSDAGAEESRRAEGIESSCSTNGLITDTTLTKLRTLFIPLPKICSTAQETAVSVALVDEQHMDVATGSFGLAEALGAIDSGKPMTLELTREPFTASEAQVLEAAPKVIVEVDLIFWPCGS